MLPLFRWEKFIGTHTKPLWIRLPTRLPVTLFIWLLALALPFQGVSRLLKYWRFHLAAPLPLPVLSGIALLRFAVHDLL